MTDNSAETAREMDPRRIDRIADDIESAAGITLEEWAGDDDGSGGVQGFIEERRLRDETKTIIVNALRSTAATVSRDREAIARIIYGDDYDDLLEICLSHGPYEKYRKELESVLVKADAILSLTPRGSGAANCELAQAGNALLTMRNELDRIRADRDSWKKQFESASAAAAEYSEFWEEHNGKFDVAGNYIPHSQLDGDLRAARAELEALRAKPPSDAGAVAMREAYTAEQISAGVMWIDFNESLSFAEEEHQLRTAIEKMNALAALPVPGEQSGDGAIREECASIAANYTPPHNVHSHELLIVVETRTAISNAIRASKGGNSLSPVLVQLVQTRCEQPEILLHDSSAAKSELVDELAGALAQAVDRMKMVEDRKHPDSNGFIPQCSAAIAAAEKALAAAGFNRDAPASLTEGDVA